jgi:hypothetical protein
LTLEWIRETLSPRVTISLMSQYYVTHKVEKVGEQMFPLINRRIRPREFEKVLEWAEERLDPAIGRGCSGILSPRFPQRRDTLSRRSGFHESATRSTLSFAKTCSMVARGTRASAVAFLVFQSR